MRVILAMLSIGTMIGITACHKEKVHDVEYYKNNTDERKQAIEACRNNPGELRGSPNCMNAFQAEKIANAQIPWK